MDVVEILFTKISNKRRSQKELQILDQSAFLEEEVKSIKLLYGLFNPEKKVLIKSVEGIGSVSQSSLSLPKRISFFKDKELNRKVYLHKALVAGVIRQLNIKNSKKIIGKKERAFQVWFLREKIQEKIKEKLPYYDEFFLELFSSVADFKYELTNNDKEFLSWIKDFKGVGEISFIDNHYEKKIEDSYGLLKKLPSKRIKNYPSGALMLWCGLMTHSQTWNQEMELHERGRSSEGGETEVDAKNVGEVEVVELEKKKTEDNPIMHSFETLHTADEYQGGYRVSDGSDEMADHQNALDELEMNAVTRSGGEVGSIYKAYIDSVFDFFVRPLNEDKKLPFIKYSEWDYKTNTMKKDFCRLFLKNNKKNDSQDEGRWREDLKEKYGDELSIWKKKVDCIVNQEKWSNRQWDGPELDIASYIDFHSDRKSGNAKESPLHMKQSKLLNETSCLILFDQSFSTDSWVNNKRVLDVELESIGLTGMLTEKFIEKIAVAGTWSQTRNQCYFRTYKSFEEKWSEFYNRASSIEPMGYTRLGPAIRHATELLSSIKAKQRVLIILTDGKPTDYDKYEGRYGIEDVGQAVKLARQSGVYTKALAIEKDAISYFPTIFGKGGFVVMNDGAQFPEKLWQICLEAAQS